MKHEIRKRSYRWGTLFLRADMTQASAPIRYSTDGESFDSTVFQSADACHDWHQAFRLVNRWLSSQAG